MLHLSSAKELGVIWDQSRVIKVPALGEKFEEMPKSLVLQINHILIQYFKNIKIRDTWVAQRLGVCLQLRA